METTKTSTRGGAIVITKEAMHGLLHLPDNYTVRGSAVDLYRNCLLIYVESDELPEVEEGTMLPIVNPLYSRDKWGHIHLLSLDVVGNNGI
jgi:hypothetical protein